MCGWTCRSPTFPISVQASRSVYPIAKRLKVCCWMSAGIFSLLKHFGRVLVSSRGRVALTAQHTHVPVPALTVFSPTRPTQVSTPTLLGGWLTLAVCLAALCMPAWVLLVLMWGRRTPAHHQPRPPATPSRSRACVSAPVLAAQVEDKHPWEGAGSGVAVPAGAAPVQLLPAVPAHSLPPPVFPRGSRIPEDPYAWMSRWPGMPAASSSPFPEVPSGCIHMTGTAGKQNLCLLDNAPTWHCSRDAPAGRG